jgi:predicted extracellular nuclease
VLSRSGFRIGTKALRSCLSVCVAAALGAPNRTDAQAGYTGGVAIDTFDGLPALNELVLPPGKGPQPLSASPVFAPAMEGWSIYARVGPQILLRIGDGSSSSSGVWSYGLEGSLDRALGTLAAGSHAANLAFVVENQTGETLNRFVLAVRGEQWRRGSGSANVLTFDYTVGASDITASALGSPVAALDFTAPVTTGSSFRLDGNSPLNQRMLSAEVTGLNWGPGQSLMLRWRDVNDSGSDDGLALDDFVFCAPRAVEPAPTLAASSPAAGQTLVRTDSVIEVVFDQPVSLGSSAFSLNGTVSGPIPFQVTGGSLRVRLEPLVLLAAGETVTVAIAANQVTGVSTQMSAAALWSFETVPAPGTLLPIHVVQGGGGVSPLMGSEVTVEGVVVGDFQGPSPALGGFFLQEEDAQTDSDAATSEGIFVYDADSMESTEVNVGDTVRVTGQVAEFSGQTQVATVTAVQIMGTGALPSAAQPILPLGNVGELESLEGMLCIWNQTLRVSGNGDGLFFNDRYHRNGELVLSSGGVLRAPTQETDPNDDPASGTSSTGISNVAAIVAAENQNDLNQIVLDDGSSQQYPDPTPYLSVTGTRRCGDTVTALVGAIGQVGGVYKVQPTVSPSFVDSNPRPSVPPGVGGRLKVGAMNVLNYFTTLGDRGADTADELVRQRDKLVAALALLEADVVGLIEIENQVTAVSDLLLALNAAVGPGVYASSVDPASGAGGDAIRTAWFYKPSKVLPVGPGQTDSDPIWSTPRPLRPPLVQVFEESSTGERFIACLNHFKSKSSAGASGLDVDQRDGQGAYSETRRQQMARLLFWLASVQQQEGDADVMILGDLNAHREEDPMDLARAAGFVDESERFSAGGHSYRFGSIRGQLDHVLTSFSMSGQVSGMAHWNINADEPGVFDYNTEAKSLAQQSLELGSPYRSSDHDPILVGLNLSPQPTSFLMWAATIAWPVGADSGINGDPDFDGLQNLVEFVLNLDPLLPDSGSGPTAFASGGELVLDYRLRSNASGVTVTPKWSENLLDWFPMSSAADQGAIDIRTRSYQATQPKDGRTQMFGRLEVLLAP